MVESLAVETKLKQNFKAFNTALLYMSSLIKHFSE